MCFSIIVFLQEILQTRFPMPRYIVTEKGGSQVYTYTHTLYIAGIIVSKHAVSLVVRILT